ncbi:MAG: hypothetical protein ACE5MI_08235 [Acidimicrobiia bacterium]
MLGPSRGFEIANREQPLTSEEMLAAARLEVVGDESPSELLVQEARRRFEAEQPDSVSEAMTRVAAREREPVEAATALERELEQMATTSRSEPRPGLTRHPTGPRTRRTQAPTPVPPDPFERQPRVSRRLRRLITLAVVAVIIIINLISDTDLIAQIEDLWNELTRGGSSGPQ